MERASPQRLDLSRTIASEARDERERNESENLVDALVALKASVGGEHAVPAEDRAFTDKVRAEAVRRSQAVSRTQMASSRLAAQSDGRPVPWWLWLLWLVAIGAVVVAVMYFT